MRAHHTYTVLIALISLAIAVPNALVAIWVWRKMRDPATGLPKQFWLGWALVLFGLVSLTGTVCGGAMVWEQVRPR